MKPKIGKCLDCSSGSPEKPLISKRCELHYWAYRNKVNSEKAKKKEPAAAVNKYERKITLGRWFNEQINQMPKYCENPRCKEYLNPYAPWSARTYIAHIVPKRNFESVAVHPFNRLFLCGDCHTNFDNWLSREIKEKMPEVVELAIERFKTFSEYIEPAEVKHLQPFLEEVFFGL